MRRAKGQIVTARKRRRNRLARPALGRASRSTPIPARIKRTSVLRRMPVFGSLRLAPVPGREGDVCAFELLPETSPVVVEAVCGRAMTLVPGEMFLATPGYRESTRFVVGGIPKRGLVPARNYWVLSESGVVGELVAGTPVTRSHLGQARYLGVALGQDDRALNIRQFAIPVADRIPDYEAPAFLFLGTSAEVGKTTAALTILRTLLYKGHQTIIALKATGTSGVTETASYQDYGAAQAFDCVDFGLPTTYPSNRADIAQTFEAALNACFSMPADAVLIECGGDMLGANVPLFLRGFRRRRPGAKVILAAADALGALSATTKLRKMGLSVALITGPCTDTPTLCQRTEELCRAPAMNLARGGHLGALP
jgi:hypothetical protein